MNATKADYGIYGPADGGYAVFQAKNIVMGKENQGFEVTYGNNLYVSAESHFANGNDGQADHPYIDFKGNAKIYASGFEDGTPAVSIPATACNPGFGNNGGGSGSANTETIRVIGEDLTVSQRSDFDFNDIVFDVSWTHAPGSSKESQTVKIKFLAAGGELPIYIGPDDESAWELHQLFQDFNTDKWITTKTMMNTAKNEQGSVIKNAYECPEKVLPNSWWSGGNIQDIANSIEIRVQKSGTLFVLKAPEGKAPSKIAVDIDYNWCGERDNIDDIYNGRFSEYVGGAYEWNTWYK